MNPTKEIFIGIDGGATKTRAIVEDSQGNILGEGFGGSSNLRLGIDQAWRSIYNAIAAALPTGINLNAKNYKFYAGMGLSGCEAEHFKQLFLAQAHPFAKLVVIKDSTAACLGAHDGADGAIIIIGTATVALQIQNGQEIKVGGWGFPHDDRGGGAWIGLKAVELTFQWLDGRLESDSALLPTIYKKFNNNLADLVEWANTAKSNQFAELAPLVIDGIQRNDLVAIEIIKMAAREVDILHATVVRKSTGKIALPVALLGGLTTFVQPWLGEDLKAHLIAPKHDAIYGALLSLKKEMINK